MLFVTCSESSHQVFWVVNQVKELSIKIDPHVVSVEATPHLERVAHCMVGLSRDMSGVL